MTDWHIQKPKISEIIYIQLAILIYKLFPHETLCHRIFKLFFFFYLSLFKLETTMDSCKILLAAIFVVTLSTVARTAPLNSPPSKIEILIRLGLSPKLANATKEVRNAIIFQCEFYSVGPEWTVSYFCRMAFKRSHSFF